MGGGRRNQAQRTKNNAKPSSSSRSADLLGSDATKLVGLITLRQNQLFNAKSTSEEEVDSIDPNFQVALKKLTKKDAVTKQKGLAELCDLCSDAGQEGCKSILGAWARAYVALAQDADNKVRERAQATHRAVVRAAGRSLAPHLRFLFPTWLLAQFDPYPPAASAASASLNELFSKNKLKDALLFCKQEIFNCINDNLLNQTTQTLSKAETSKEDMETKYERVILCSLLAYVQYVELYAPTNPEEFESVNRPLIASSKFCHLASFKAPQVRSAWCSTLVALCRCAPELVRAEAKGLGSAVFGALDELDPSALPQVWEAALHTLLVLKEGCDKAQLEKIIIPKVCHVLEKGGHGNAAAVYPNLLPFLSSFYEITSDKNKFFESFFTSLQTGLYQPNVKLSMIESEAIVKTFFECLRFITLRHCDDPDFCLHLLNTKLIAVLRKALADPSLSAMSDPYLWGIAEVLDHWARNSNVELNNLAEKLWPAVAETCSSGLDEVLTDPPHARHTLMCQARLLEAFFRPAPQPRRNLRVRFAGGKEESLATESERRMVEPDAAVAESLKHLWWDLAKKQWSAAECACPAVRSSAAEALASGVRLLGWPECSLPSGNEICSKLKQWLKDDPASARSFLALAFAALPSLDNDARAALLSHLAQELPESVLTESVSLVAKGPPNRVSELANWLQGQDAYSALLVLLNENSPYALDALKRCFSTTLDREFVVGSKNSEALLAAICKIISAQTDSAEVSVESAVDFVAELMVVIWNSHADGFFTRCGDSASTLLKDLLERWLHEPHNVKVATAWQSGAECLLKFSKSVLIESMLEHSAKVIAALLSYGDLDWSGSAGESRVAVLVDVVKTLGGDEPIKTALNLVYLLHLRCLSPWLEPLEELVRMGLRLRGYQSSVGSGCAGNKLEGDWAPLGETRINTYVAAALFSTRLISGLISPDGLLNEDCLPNFTEHISTLVFASCLAENLQNFFFSTKQCYESKELIKHFLPVLCELTSKFKPTDRSQLISSIANRDTISNLLSWREREEFIAALLSEVSIDQVQSVRIATEGLEEDSLRALRKKLACKSKEMQTHFSFTCWKITTTCKHESVVLFNKQLNGAGATELSLSAEIARLLRECLHYDLSRVEPKTWDFIIISTAAWIESIGLTHSPFHYVEFVSFVRAVCELYIEVTRILDGNEKLVNLAKEWSDLFAIPSSLSLLNSWKRLAGECYCRGDPVILHHIESLSDAVRHIVSSENFSNTIQGPGFDIKIWAKDSAKLLLSSCPAVQMTAYQILLSLAPSIAKSDADLNEEMLNRLSIQLFQETLQKTQTVVTTMLQGIKLGVACLVEPFTDSYIYTRAYLFVWLVVVKLFCEASPEARHLYTLSIKESELLEQLMETLLRLLPEKVLGERGAPVSPELSARLAQDLFLSPPPLHYGAWSSAWLGSLACWTYWQVLRWLPLLARRWYGGAEGPARDLADRVTARHVTPTLVQEEIAYARANARAHDQLAVDCVGGAGGLVTATYSLEDSKVQLGIALGPNHPFTPPRLDMSRSCVAGQASHRLRQLALLPTLQNATVWDCIVTWKNYLDKKFEGVEDCYICYSVLAPGTQQLPNFTCRTCRKKFHYACLYKWFTSSSKSTCPICRNLF